MTPLLDWSKMKICMLPETSELGVGRVLEAYRKHLPAFGVQFVSEEDADLVVCHAGNHAKHRQTDVLVCHGLYPTATVDKSTVYFDTNADVIRNAREARAITVPSSWVAMPFKRDMALSPYIVPHGIDVDEWHPSPVHDNYVLWAKGHKPGVVDTTIVNELAELMPDQEFVTTFGKPSSNVRVTGVLPFAEMKKMMAKAGVYLAVTKETFGIQTLEAMACGVPIVGYTHGATPDIVTHGITGWLTKPGDLNGLVAGIRWAFDNQHALSVAEQNAVRRFTWEAACERLYNVLKSASTNDNTPLVSVIIPCYNYGKWVGNAIESVLRQTYPGPKEIIVVNDGSTDSTDDDIKPYLDRVTYYSKQNGGVAEARNYGVRHSHGELIACLDADDSWEPEFLSSLVPPMIKDRALGLAYGHLQSNNGQGTFVSGWPPPFDFREQAARHNRVPSSCVYRRTAWERAGGYRAQYTPAEDAELWLRIAAVGFNVRKITDTPVYTYRLHSHSLSRTIKEPDWVTDKPYHDNMDLAPFAAPAVDGRSSHPFKDYDDPWVSIIIPVGPGHENLVYRALDSLQSQSVTNWEAIVVNDSGQQLTQPMTGLPLAQAYPFITEVNSGRSGVAKARNLGAKQARADMLVFLDADDWLLPGYLAYTIQAYNDNPNSYMYTDWLGFDGSKTSSHISKEFTIAGLLKEALHPITALVPRAWHDEIGGFDEVVSGWEDWFYYLDLVKAGHCGCRVGYQGLVYDYSSGLRREDSLRKRNELLPEVRKRYKEDNMACSGGCGGKRGGGNGRSSSNVVPSQNMSMNKGVPVMAARPAPVDDNKMVAVRENSGNIGAHGVIGVRTRINYGRHKHGDVFQMHKDDVLAQPHRYSRVEESMAQLPQPAKPEAPVVEAPQYVAPAPMPVVEKPVVPAPEELVKAAMQPVPDDEIEVDITILPLVQIKRLELDAGSAKDALELERSAPKPRKSVIEYLESLADQ